MIASAIKADYAKKQLRKEENGSGRKVPVTFNYLNVRSLNNVGEMSFKSQQYSFFKKNVADETEKRSKRL